MTRTDSRTIKDPLEGINSDTGTTATAETGQGGVSPHEGSGWDWNDGLDSFLNFGLGVFQTSKGNATDGSSGGNTGTDRYAPPPSSTNNTVVYILGGFVLLVIVFFMLVKS